MNIVVKDTRQKNPKGVEATLRAFGCSQRTIERALRQLAVEEAPESLESGSRSEQPTTTALLPGFKAQASRRSGSRHE